MGYGGTARITSVVGVKVRHLVPVPSDRIVGHKALRWLHGYRILGKALWAAIGMISVMTDALKAAREHGADYSVILVSSRQIQYMVLQQAWAVAAFTKS